MLRFQGNCAINDRQNIWLWEGLKEKHPCTSWLSAAYLNGKQPAWYLQHRGAAEVFREELDVDGGWHEDETEVRPIGQQGAQDAEEEVAVEMSLMDLIHDDHLILIQDLVLLDLTQQESLGQEEQLSGWRPRSLEADLIPNLEM